MIALVDEAATLAAGASLAPVLRAGDVVTLSGDLGAGKSTFARGLLAALGLDGEAPSPTFAIVQPYAPPEVRLAIAHVDLYRIEEASELDELALDELAADGALIVEWPERAPDRWPDALALRIAIDGAGRRLTWHGPAAWSARWPPPSLLAR